MSQVVFPDKTSCFQALSDVRNDATPTDWALFGYVAGTKNHIVLEGSGSGGLPELHSRLKDDSIQYGYLRMTDNYEGTTTVKFIVILWVGEKVKINTKALCATHKGEVREMLGQSHIELYASTLDDCSYSLIMEKVSDASGSANRVLTDDRTRSSAAHSPATSNIQRGTVGKDDLVFPEEDEIRRTIVAVRADSQPEDWVLVSYQGQTNTIRLVGSGSGGVDELKSHLTDDNIYYGLLRVTESVDEHLTVKFVFIYFLGPKVSTFRKAKVTTHKGAITSFFGQYHNDFETSDHHELTHQDIMKRVSAASGTANFVKEADLSGLDYTADTPVGQLQRAGTGVATKKSPAPQREAPRSVQNIVTFVGEEQIRQAIQAVRRDNDPTDWALITYDGPKSSNLVLRGSGSGGFAELRDHLEVGGVSYGLLRRTNEFDGHVTVKFVLVIHIDEKVPVIRKAKIVTHKGAITEFFGQYHVDITIASPSELTEELVDTTVQNAAGTAVHVK
eukprot:TRINITY_DN3945_c0_g1_i4.p1 TRINITY_DN3945_c0_g1~~TRINITY_DN3945_c0_g1_i4.p1  ORF type:complete len:503 (-),score=133.06 TRINITY_DN3945_c0_g1_i4:72-1580(-)